MTDETGSALRLCIALHLRAHHRGLVYTDYVYTLRLASEATLEQWEDDTRPYRLAVWVWRALSVLLAGVALLNGLGPLHPMPVILFTLPVLQHWLLLRLVRLCDVRHDSVWLLALCGLMSEPRDESAIQQFVYTHWAKTFVVLSGAQKGFARRTVDEKAQCVIRSLYRQWRRTRLKELAYCTF